MTSGRILAFLLIFVVSLATMVLVQQRDPEEPTVRETETDWTSESPLFGASEAGQSMGSSTQTQSVSEREVNESPTLFYFEGDPYPFLIGSYLYALDNAEERFREEYPKYLDGNAESIYVMSLIARHCSQLLPYDYLTHSPDLKALEDRMRDGFNSLPSSSPEDVEFLPIFEEAAIAYLPVCVEFLASLSGKMRIQELKSGEPTIHDMQLLLMKDAARAGNAFAKLELLDQYVKTDYRNFQESAKLLESVIKSGDPRAYLKVHNFYTRFRIERGPITGESEAAAWSLLSCSVNELCRISVLEETLENSMDPIELHNLYELVDDIQYKLTRGEELGFARFRQASDFIDSAEESDFVKREEISWETEF